MLTEQTPVGLLPPSGSRSALARLKRAELAPTWGGRLAGVPEGGGRAWVMIQGAERRVSPRGPHVGEGHSSGTSTLTPGPQPCPGCPHPRMCPVPGEDKAMWLAVAAGQVRDRLLSLRVTPPAARTCSAEAVGPGEAQNARKGLLCPAPAVPREVSVGGGVWRRTWSLESCPA